MIRQKINQSTHEEANTQDTMSDQLASVQQRTNANDKTGIIRRDEGSMEDKKDEYKIDFFVAFNQNLTTGQQTGLTNIGNLINNFDAANPGLLHVSVIGGDNSIHRDETGNAAMRAANRAQTVVNQLNLTIPLGNQFSLKPTVAAVQQLQNQVTPPVYASDFAAMGYVGEQVNIILEHTDFSTIRKPFSKLVDKEISRMGK